MSVTIGDIMKLPSLREAKVVAGLNGLDRTITSITVLEAYTKDIGAEKFGNMRSYGSELTLTGFITIPDDVEAQCKIVEKMAREGEAGLIVYYVGKIVKNLNQKVIERAEAFGLTLILMPEKRMELRYSDVICEVMEAIVKDQLTDNYFASDMMERISHLEKRQRNINSVLNMLRDRTHCSLFLTDGTKHILNGAEWPRDRGLPISQILELYNKEQRIEGEVVLLPIGEQSFWMTRMLAEDNKGTRSYLLLVKETDNLTTDLCKQSLDVIRTYINLWAEDYGHVNTKQLIHSILADEPEKMGRIAEILHIDIRKISSMAFFSVVKKPEKGILEQYLDEIRLEVGELLRSYVSVFFAEVYEEGVAVFFDRGKRIPVSVWEKMLEELERKGGRLRLTIFQGLVTTGNAKEAYELCKQQEDTAALIYPEKRLFSGGEMFFSEHCRNICDAGEKAILLAKRPILMLLKEDQRKDLLSTLQVYLLDANMRVAKTAELMFVHKNTIKYRISCIEELLGVDVDKMPDAYGLSVAVALERLIHT